MSRRRKRYRTLGRRQRRRLRPAIELESVMMLLLMLMLMLLLFCISASSAAEKDKEQQQQREETLIIRTDLGQLFRGTKQADSRVAAFLGLRYAGAPVRRLRFMPPTPFTYAQAAASNSAANQLVHDARRPGPICMQRFPVDFTRQQLDYMNELRNVSHRRDQSPRSQEAKFNLQLELMDELLPSGSFFSSSPHRKWRSSQTKGLDHLRARKLLELEQSEDCLNLNIYTPIEVLKERITTPTQRHFASGIDNNSNNNNTGNYSQLLPVLVLIQADSFDYGSPSATISASSAAQFARDNRLLVITFNFRLNLLGFPPPPKLQHITQHQQQQHITQQQQQHHRTNNNLGLLDQVALLHWLQANVRSFGGSPRNVTLMGLRAGAICVNLLMLSPLAKGLFSRAILEDGAALSPMVANNLQYISNSQQQQVALQQVRLIAQLSGCGGSNGNNSDVSLMFECLKSAPIEQLMQQIPFGLLLDTGSASGAGIMQDGQVALARRWHRPLELLFRTIIELDHQLVPARLKMTLNEFSNQLFGGNEPTAANQQVNVNRTQLDKLIAYLIITKQAINAGASVDQRQSGASVELVSELLDDLLNAIYLPSNETLVSPLYAPHLDTGTLLHHHEHDLTSALLAPRSLFSRHDLLIGSSRPLIDHPSSGGGAVKSMLELPADVQLTEISGGGGGLKPTDSADYQFASLPVQRFGRRVMEQVGLSEEQAIQQVNLFVRTFYRFHQQEIANSIINHYFLNDKNSGDRQKNLTTGGEQNKDDDKQLHLLRSLINLYQDSLVSVPLIKTALIHSMKQLESLAEFYISQRLVNLNERLKFLSGDISKLQLHERESLADSAAENFRPFLGQLYASPALWPLQLMSTTGNGSAGGRAEVLDTIHSTYLYQFDNDIDSFALVEQILAVINELAQQLEQKPKGRAILLAEVRSNLVDNLLKPMLHHQYQHYTQSLSLSCGLQDSDGEDHHMGKLFRWQCAQIGRQIVAKFVAHGNVNVAQSKHDNEKDTREPIELKLDQYEANCVQQQQQQWQQAMDVDNNSTRQDHLVIALDEAVTGSGTQKSECEDQLNRLSMDYLLAKLSNDNRSTQSGNEWRVFDVFEQQMATLTATSVGRQPAWSTDGRQFAGNNTYDTSDSFARARQHFDRKIAFWANFIPTLNCSRTQPIGPASLQLFSQAPNSTLLNMNLNFNCQSVGTAHHNTETTGTRTANSLIRALELKIKSAISEHLNRLTKQQQLRLSTSNGANNNQNHHSLRMATTSNEISATPSAGGRAQDESPNSAADQQRILFGSDGNMSLVNTWFTVDGEQRQQQQQQLQQSFFASATGNRHQTLLGLWLIAGAILLGSTILTSGCVLMKHLKRQRSPQAVGQLDNKTISLSIISTGDTTPPPPTQPVMLEVLPPAPVDCSASTTTPSSSSTSTSLVSQQQQQQHHHQESLGPAYEFNHRESTFQNHTYEPNQNMNEESEEQQQQPFLMPIIQGTRYIEHLPECNSTGAQVQMPNGNINMEAIAQAFSSGSEATTTTTTQRALSSVSLISSSTITNNNNTTHGMAASNGNNATRQQVKKRVKISDPKRQHFDEGNTFMITKEDQLLQPVYLDGDFLVPQLEGQSTDNFCPIHRSSSTYLISAGPNNQAHITNNDYNNNNNCDTNLNDAPNRLDFLNNGQFSGYMSGSESFNNAINETDNYHRHHNHFMAATPQPLAVGQLGSQQEIYQGNHHQMRSINRKQQRRVKQAPGGGRVCLVYNRIGLNNDVMNGGTSDQLSRNSTTLDR